MAKRIVFRIDTELFTKFSEVAETSGKTKAQLLRDWIALSLNLYETQPANLGQMQTYNFYLDSHLLSELNQKAAKRGISVSHYLRSLIHHQLTVSSIIESHTNNSVVTKRSTAQELWQRGELQALSNLDEIHLNGILPTDLLLVATACVDLGKINQALQLVDRILNSPINNQNQEVYLQALACIVRGMAYIHENKPRLASDSLNNAIKFGEIINNRLIMGIASYYQADLYRLQDNLPQAISTFEQAIEYLDIYSTPHIIILSYLGLAGSYSITGVTNLAAHYLARAKELLIKYPNPRGELYYLHIESYLNYFNHNQIQPALNSIRQGINLNLSLGSSIMNAYNYEMLAEVNIFNGDEDIGYTFANKSRVIYNSIPEATVSIAEMFEMFIQSKHRYNVAIKRMSEINDIQSGMIKPNSKEFLFRATQFVRSPNIDERNMGERKLVELMHRSNNAVIKKACELTLQNKKLQAIVV